MSVSSPVLSPFQVTVNGGKIPILFMNAADQLPTAFALMGTTARRRVALRLAGGCKGMTREDKVDMMNYFKAAFEGFEGLIWSGGTRVVGADGELDPMITDVPGLIAAHNPGAVALGSIPRVDLLTLENEGRLVLDSYGTIPNPTMSGLLVVQSSPDGEGAWDLDVPTTFALMEQWKSHARFERVGYIAWNGGPITRDEIIGSLKRGWPTILVSGSQRVTDELIEQWSRSDPTLIEKIGRSNPPIIVQRSDPDSLRTALVEAGFLS